MMVYRASYGEKPRGINESLYEFIIAAKPGKGEIDRVS